MDNDVFLFIADYLKKFHTYPTHKDIMKEFSIGKKKSAGIVSRLVKAGYFEKGKIK